MVKRLLWSGNKVTDRLCWCIRLALQLLMRMQLGGLVLQFQQMVLLQIIHMWQFQMTEQKASAIWVRNDGTNNIAQSKSATISGSSASWEPAMIFPLLIRMRMIQRLAYLQMA